MSEKKWIKCAHGMLVKNSIQECPKCRLGFDPANFEGLQNPSGPGDIVFINPNNGQVERIPMPHPFIIGLADDYTIRPEGNGKSLEDAKAALDLKRQYMPDSNWRLFKLVEVDKDGLPIMP